MAEDAAGASIPWISEPVPGLGGPFCANVQALLARVGKEQRIQGGAWRGRAWTVALWGPQGGPPLHVYEERFEGSERASCEQCRCNGWQHHPLSDHKYHFILPSQAPRPDAPVLPIDWTGREPGPRPRGPAPLESKHHILHGVLHPNGYGHLLRINGLEGGSRGRTGREVMAFWDGLCGALRVRSVSIEDVSNRRGMLLRILHAAGHRRTWYGEWGYAFGRAGYNIQQADWQRAVEEVHGSSLAGLLQDFRAGGVDERVVRIVERYKGAGGDEVKTLGEWLKRLMAFTHDPEWGRQFLARHGGGRRAGLERQIALPALARAFPQVRAALERAGAQVAELLEQGPGPDAPGSAALLERLCRGGEATGNGASKRLRRVKREPEGGAAPATNGAKGEPDLECQEPRFNAPHQKGGRIGGQSVRAPRNKGDAGDVNGSDRGPSGKAAGQVKSDGLWKRLNACPRSTRSRRMGSGGVGKSACKDAVQADSDCPDRTRSGGGARAGTSKETQGGGQRNGTAMEGQTHGYDAHLLSVLQALGKQGADVAGQAASLHDTELLAAMQHIIKEGEGKMDGEGKANSAKARRSERAGRRIRLGQNGAALGSLPTEVTASNPDTRKNRSNARKGVTAPPRVSHKRRQPGAPVLDGTTPTCSHGEHTQDNLSRLVAVKTETTGCSVVKSAVNGRFKQKQKQAVSFNGACDAPTDLVKPPVKPFDPKLLLQGPRNWSAHKLVEFLRIVLSVLQTIEGHWVRLQELRELLYATAHDRVLADWVLGRLANTTFANGCVVYKTHSEWKRRHFFLFETLKNKKSRSRAADAEPSCPIANGSRPPHDQGLAASRFDKFLSDVFKWLCANPNVQVGKPTVSKDRRLSSESIDRQVTDADAEGMYRITRSRTEGALTRELRQLEPEKSLLENLATARARERRKRPGPGDHGYSRPAKKSRGLSGHKLGHSPSNSLVRLVARIQQALDMPDIPWLHGPRTAVEPFLDALERRGAIPGAEPVLNPSVEAKGRLPTLKDQQMADLIYVYQNVLESYMPLYFQNGKFSPEATLESASKLCLAKLPDAVQILVDTKLFVKEYENGPRLVLPRKPGEPRLVQLMCEVDLVPRLPSGYKDRFGSGKAVKLPSFFKRKPPAMAVYVPERCDIEEAKRRIQAAFKETYLMFKDWSVVHIQGLRFGGRKSRLMPVDEGAVVKVKGKDIHNEPELRHAGGIEDWEVSCRCGTEDDDGERMVACDRCGVWMHVRCAGFRSEDEIPELFECPECITKRSHNSGDSPRQ
ncbi:unnamed protein product [Ostreobium quekettii]|uniref:PHD-type domain-containing protein n=1 Tax=Ostreobium quekettii TaxID=121088 RepID=A0A8S1IYF7_9CHLO|nr:unnamed protein product [Ostreobium quekettii]